MEQGAGANKYVYFVSNNGIDGWRKLPDVQPLFISKSRKMRKLLSGNLDLKVSPFDWSSNDRLSANLLSKQLKLIISAH